MTRYSLKQFLNEDSNHKTSSRVGSISNLIAGMQKIKTLNEELVIPITPKGTGWDHLTDPNRLRRVFTIENPCSRRQFVNDALNLSDQSMHGIIIRIHGEETEVEIYTEELNDITEIDFEYAKDIDEMYVDSMFSYNNQNLGATRELW